MTLSRFESTHALRDFVDLDLARRLEAAETTTPERMEALRPDWPEAALETIGGGTASFFGKEFPANHIVGMGLYGPVSEAEFARLEEFYGSRGVECEVVLSPLADASLWELLGARGYRIKEFNSVLILRLEEYEPPPLPEGVTVERVTPETAMLWSGVIGEGFAEFGPVPDNLLAPYARVPDCINLLGRVDGVAAGGGIACVIREAGIVALFGSSTLPQYRRRGVQSALIERRLYEAAQSGCEYAVVSTLPGSGSQRNMERRGFRVAYTKVVLVRSWPELKPASP